MVSLINGETLHTILHSLIVGLALQVGFVDHKKNIEYHQTYTKYITKD